MGLHGEIVEYLKANGACLCGFAGLGPTGGGFASWPRAVSFAVPLAPGVVAEILRGPTPEYLAEYRRANALIDRLAAGVSALLSGRGSRAFAVSATTSEYDADTLSSGFSHKTAATLAGLGWIGRCALLVTREFGSAVRLGTVVTDAELPDGKPVTESMCGDCTRCVEACPGGAPSGREWKQGLPRDAFFDAHACRDAARRLSAERLGEAVSVCGICISVCRFTQRYVEGAR